MTTTRVGNIITGTILAVFIASAASAQSTTGSSGSGSTTPGTMGQGTAGQGTTGQGSTTSGGQTTKSSGRSSSGYNSGGGGFGDEHSWFGSALVGSSFAQSADDANVNIGASIGYLFKRAVGFEFAADFSPNFVVAEVPLGENQVNSYMFNAVGALPIGTGAMVQPFVEGGIGAITLRSDQAQFGGSSFPGINDNQFAFNLGAGVMGFKNHWGVRADVRYIRAVGNASDNSGALLGTSSVGPNGLDTNGNFQLSNVDFWRTNFGVAFRW